VFLLKYDPHFSRRCVVVGQPSPPCVPIGGFKCLLREHRVEYATSLLIHVESGLPFQRTIQFIGTVWDSQTPAGISNSCVGNGKTSVGFGNRLSEPTNTSEDKEFRDFFLIVHPSYVRRGVAHPIGSHLLSPCSEINEICAVIDRAYNRCSTAIKASKTIGATRAFIGAPLSRAKRPLRPLGEGERQCGCR